MSGPVEHLVSLAVVVDGVELPIQREADISHGHPFVQVSPGSLFSLRVTNISREPLAYVVRIDGENPNQPTRPWGTVLLPGTPHVTSEWVTGVSTRYDGSVVTSTGPLAFSSVPLVEKGSRAGGASGPVLSSEDEVARLGTFEVEVWAVQAIAPTPVAMVGGGASVGYGSVSSPKTTSALVEGASKKAKFFPVSTTVGAVTSRVTPAHEVMGTSSYAASPGPSRGVLTLLYFDRAAVSVWKRRAMVVDLSQAAPAAAGGGAAGSGARGAGARGAGGDGGSGSDVVDLTGDFLDLT